MTNDPAWVSVAEGPVADDGGDDGDDEELGAQPVTAVRTTSATNREVPRTVTGELLLGEMRGRPIWAARASVCSKSGYGNANVADSMMPRSSSTAASGVPA